MVIDCRLRGAAMCIGCMLCLLAWGAAFRNVHAQQGRGEARHPTPPLDVYELIRGRGADEFADGGLFVVTFGATWCPPCRKAAPYLAGLAERYGDDVHFAYVYTLESKPADAFPQGLVDRVRGQATYGDGLTNFSIGLDRPGYTNADAWGVHGVPISFVVGRDGRTAWKGNPFNLAKPLQVLLEGGPLDSVVGRMAEEQELRRQEVKRARALKSMGECREALFVLDSLSARFPGDGGLFGQRFHVLAGYDNEKAYELLNEMLEKGLAYVDWMNIMTANIPSIQESDRDYDTEIRVLGRALQEESNERFHAPILYMMAEALAGRKSYGNAARTLEQAIALQEKHDRNSPALQGYRERLRRYRALESGDGGIGSKGGG